MPRRFETVVFRCPEEPRSLCVKRVVGLPGETIQIQGGDVLVDGTIARKGARAAREMTVPVYDAPPLTGRWQAQMGWEPRDGHFAHAGNERQEQSFTQPTKPKPPFEWIVYHHRRRAAAGSDPQPSAVVDESPCDQSESRECTPVADLAVACELQTSGFGDVALHVQSAGDLFEVRIELATGEGELSQNHQPCALVNVAVEPFSRFAWLELVVIDHQALVLVNRKVVAEYEYQPAAESNPIAAGQAGLPADEIAAVGCATPRSTCGGW